MASSCKSKVMKSYWYVVEGGEHCESMTTTGGKVRVFKIGNGCGRGQFRHGNDVPVSFGKQCSDLQSMPQKRLFRNHGASTNVLMVQVNRHASQCFARLV